QCRWCHKYASKVPVPVCGPPAAPTLFRLSVMCSSCVLQLEPPSTITSPGKPHLWRSKLPDMAWTDGLVTPSVKEPPVTCAQEMGGSPQRSVRSVVWLTTIDQAPQSPLSPTPDAVPEKLPWVDEA